MRFKLRIIFCQVSGANRVLAIFKLNPQNISLYLVKAHDKYIQGSLTERESSVKLTSLY